MPTQPSNIPTLDGLHRQLAALFGSVAPGQSGPASVIQRSAFSVSYSLMVTTRYQRKTAGGRLGGGGGGLMLYGPERRTQFPGCTAVLAAVPVSTSSPPPRPNPARCGGFWLTSTMRSTSTPSAVASALMLRLKNIAIDTLYCVIGPGAVTLKGAGALKYVGVSVTSQLKLPSYWRRMGLLVVGSSSHLLIGGESGSVDFSKTVSSRATKINSAICRIRTSVSPTRGMRGTLGLSLEMPAGSRGKNLEIAPPVLPLPKHKGSMATDNGT